MTVNEASTKMARVTTGRRGRRVGAIAGRGQSRVPAPPTRKPATRPPAVVHRVLAKPSRIPRQMRSPITPLRPSAAVGGDEDLLECFELLEALAAPDGHAVERVGSGIDRHAGFLLEAGLEAVEEGSTAGEDDA